MSNTNITSDRSIKFQSVFESIEDYEKFSNDFYNDIKEKLRQTDLASRKSVEKALCCCCKG